jgi:hypothetical protein
MFGCIAVGDGCSGAGGIIVANGEAAGVGVSATQLWPSDRRCIGRRERRREQQGQR